MLGKGRCARFGLLWAAVAATVWPAGTLPAWADDGAITLELNKLEPVENACRAYLLLTNRTKDAFTSLKLDLVMFDKKGIVARRVAVEAAPVSAGKTSLKVFDIQGVTCGNIGRVLLNGVMTCADNNGPHRDCVDMIELSSKAPGVPLIK